MISRQFAERTRTTGFANLLRHIAIVATASAVLIGSFGTAWAFTRAERQAFQKSIVDRRARLNPKFTKTTRKKTRFIIVHTSEGGLKSTLRVVSSGKRLRRSYRTKGGHAHYVIARDGRVYRTLDKRFVADHAGRSMWNGQTDISKISIGIELVGYHYGSITEKQYRSVGLLIEILQRIYDLDDSAVLTHSQVAYGKPNRWVRNSHRGRKRCAKNFDHTKAGLAPTWPFDPDVKAGRLVADPQLASIYYAPRKPSSRSTGGNVISSTNTAWNIAGDEYNSPTTLYRLPNGKVVPGHEVEERIGWNRIPKNTVVLLNQEEGDPAGESEGPVRRISDGYTAWDIAGFDYNKASTFYFFPRGRVASGREVSDWDELPANTRMIVGYRGPYEVTARRPAGIIAGKNYNKKDTLYYFPNKKIISGDSVRDFARLPKGVLVFLPSTG
ncbi:MAG: N-acetylmuramoyl-L-alanine amidase [Candidatus Latescibacterota bacterium]|nr:MAG: N-acetylmuramoyl-L-alanine amidase [Candidatus Latescibacterota bacterium]